MRIPDDVLTSFSVHDAGRPRKKSGADPKSRLDLIAKFAGGRIEHPNALREGLNFDPGDSAEFLFQAGHRNLLARRRGIEPATCTQREVLGFDPGADLATIPPPELDTFVSDRNGRPAVGPAVIVLTAPAASDGRPGAPVNRG